MPSAKKSTKLSKEDNLSLEKDYIGFLRHVQKRLQNAQLKAARAVSIEQIHFYWEIGSDIIKHQANRRWGSHFLDQLSLNMRNACPGMQGFSKRNLEYMRLLATVYPSWDEFTQQPAAQLPWSLIQLLLDKYKADPIKLTWYAEKVIENGWSRSSLSMYIKSDLYERQGMASQKVSNYLERLPSPQSDLAHEMLKNPYNFNFLTVSQKTHEREIESALITHIRDFLLELGTGFSFVGTQVPLDVDGEEFFIDILFYHLKLRSYVVSEIKAKKFKPADLGQLSFCLSAVDSNMKHETDNPTIGMSEYTLSKVLPSELKTALPSIETIESKLNASIQLDSDHGKK